MTIPRPRFGRRLAALAASGALAAGALAALAPPATAASPTTTTGSGPTAVSGASLTWGLSGEQGGGAFFGGCNFLSAGTAGNTGSSRLWTEADGFYKTRDGNVTVEKPDPDDVYAQPTWGTKCQTPAGTNASPSSPTSLTKNRVRLSDGAGTVDVSTGAATISWTGSFTSVFYGGLTYWSASNPRLVVDAAGNGTLTATASGYGTDMNDPTQWVPIAGRPITLATLENVDVDADGFISTPDYLGVEVTTSGTAQTRTGGSWGAFPQSFVDFQNLTGQSSYWYSSGGSRDTAKPATALSVSGYTVAPAPAVTVSQTSVSPEGQTSVTVTGTGFDPALATGTRQPFANRPGGAYVAFGKFADAWRPSTGAASASRGVLAADTALTKWAVPAAQQGQAGGSAVVLSPDGGFTATVVVDKAKIDAAHTSPTLTRYGIVTYPGSGASAAAYETLTPITFAVPQSTPTVDLDGPTSVAVGDEATYTVAVSDDATGSVTLTGAGDDPVEKDLTDGSASFTLPATTPAGSLTLTATYNGSTTLTTATDTLDVTVTPAPKATSAPTITARDAVAYGGAQPVTVTVPTVGGVVPTGTVTLGGAGTQTKALTNGTASFTLARTTAVGTSTLTAVYSGDDAYLPADAAKSFKVVKANVTTSSATTRKPTSKKTGTATVRVASRVAGAPRATGTIRVYFTTSGKATKYTTKTLTAGAAKITVPKLAKGTWTVKVKYYGSGALNPAATAKKATIRVTR